MPPKRGGTRQRRAAAEADAREVIASSLVNYLLTQWAWGLISAVTVQAVAMHAMTDMSAVTVGLTCNKQLRMLETLAGLGCKGKHPNNCAQNLRNAITTLDYQRVPMQVMVPLADSSGANPTMMAQEMLLPHVWFSIMFNSYYSSFCEKICANREQISEFWRSQRGSPRMQGHPVTSRTGYMRRCIPIRLHGDGVPVTGVGKSWSKCADVYSWCSVFATGPTISFNFYIWAVFKTVQSKAFNRNTKAVFWQILVWSLQWAWLGLWPDKNWDGSAFTRREDIDRALTPLAGPDDDFFFLCLWGLLGDLEYFYTEYGLQNYNSGDPCNKCPATNIRGGMCVNEFRREHCEWMRKLYTKRQWQTSVYNTHPIFKLPGVTILSVCADLMHCKHLGTDAYFYGSVLFVLCYYMLPGTPQQNIEIVWAKIRCNYKAGGCRYTNMLLSMFSSVANPELSMPCLKGRAIEVRDIGPPLLIVFQSFMLDGCCDVPPIQQQQISIALQKSIAMDTILHDNRHVIKFTNEVYQAFETAGFTYLIVFNALGTYYAETHVPAKKIFDVTIKAHYVGHCIIEAEFLNPRIGWCYAGEDFMFRVRRLLSSCTHNSTPSQSVRLFIKKYVIAMHLMHKN
jgi:hypothetical protein